MKNTDAFVKLCSRLISEYEAGLLDFHLAAEKIFQQAKQHPLAEGAHPMLHRILDLSFNILEDYRSDQADEADWCVITKTIKNYIAGDWESTCWVMNAMYGEYAGGQLVRSYSVAVRRRNGETVIETASGTLKDELLKIIKQLHAEQTDERYLQNLAQIAPATIDTYELASVEATEYLA